MLEIQLQDELNCKQSGESTALYLNFKEKANREIPIKFFPKLNYFEARLLFENKIWNAIEYPVWIRKCPESRSINKRHKPIVLTIQSWV